MDIFLGVEDFQVVLPPQKNGTALPLVLEAGHESHIYGCKLKVMMVMDDFDNGIDDDVDDVIED